MKKLALSLAVLFSVALVSCGGAKTEAADSNDSMNQDTNLVAEDTNKANDTDTNNVTVIEAAEEVVETPAK